jgi:hypothetical protein
VLSVVDMPAERAFKGAVVPVTSGATTSGLYTFLFKPGDDSLAGVGIDGMELDTVP